MSDKETIEIIKLLKKQNSLLINIYKKLDELGVDEKKKKPVDIAKLESELYKNSETIPKLTDNERNLEICHVVKNGILYTFNRGICVENRPATQFENYVHRSAD